MPNIILRLLGTLHALNLLIFSQQLVLEKSNVSHVSIIPDPEEYYMGAPYYAISNGFQVELYDLSIGQLQTTIQIPNMGPKHILLSATISQKWIDDDLGWETMATSFDTSWAGQDSIYQTNNPQYKGQLVDDDQSIILNLPNSSWVYFFFDGKETFLVSGNYNPSLKSSIRVYRFRTVPMSAAKFEQENFPVPKVFSFDVMGRRLPSNHSLQLHSFLK